jgi:hypothetical protein
LKIVLFAAVWQADEADRGRLVATPRLSTRWRADLTKLQTNARFCMIKDDRIVDFVLFLCSFDWSLSFTLNDEHRSVSGAFVATSARSAGGHAERRK